MYRNALRFIEFIIVVLEKFIYLGFHIVSRNLIELFIFSEQVYTINRKKCICIAFNRWDKKYGKVKIVLLGHRVNLSLIYA